MKSISLNQSFLSLFSGHDVAYFVVLGGSQTDLVAEQVSNVREVVVDHCGTLKTESPSNYINIFWQAHGTKHLRSENSTVADFNPPLESWMVSKDLKRRLSVWIVSRLILQLGNADLLIELADNSHQVTQTNAAVCNHAFALMELSQVSGIESLVSEHSID